MFSVVFVCLSVCLAVLERSLEKLRTDCDEFFWSGLGWSKEQGIFFYYGS